MTAVQRPTTNLIIPEHLMLPKKALKEGFLYVYSGAYTGPSTTFMMKLWVGSLFPSIANNPAFGKYRPRKVADQLAKVVPSGYLRIKKVQDPRNPYFLASVPLMSFTKHSSSALTQFLHSWLLGHTAMKHPPQWTPEAIQESNDLNDQMKQLVPETISDIKIAPEKVIQLMKLDAVGTNALKTSLLGVRIQTKGNLSVIFADFKISREEAQQLTTTDWTELRDIDLYPVLLHWCTSIWGTRALAPVASFSVSKIAFSLPPEHSESARVNEHNLSIGPDGKPYFLPKSVDKQQTIAYEDMYAKAGSRGDGSFALNDIEAGATAMESGKALPNALPINMEISVDWLNNKYAYTNTGGLLTVIDLTRYRTADASHIRELMDNTVVTDKEIYWFQALGEASGIPASEFDISAKDFEGIDDSWASKLYALKGDPRKYFDLAVKAYKSIEEQDAVVFSDIATNSSFAPLRPLARYLKKVEAAAKSNLPAIYLKYSVSTVSSMFPWLVLIANYSDNMTHIRAEDKALRKAATDQGVDPNWKMPSVPLVKEDMGLLPHQVKVQNIMREDPDIALLPISAGGGKTPMLLVDLLLHYKANKDEPYLVICPNHLVPNYVREAVYFTAGKLNVVAITNFAIRQNGWKRLQAIAEAAPRNTVFVVALDTLRFRPRSVSYGVTPVTVFPVIDFLRQFKFGYIAVDEAHRIKGKTARNQAVMALLSDIPKKRLASGTFVHDSPSDLARIVGALDPTLFGTREEFNERFGEVVKGDRVLKWRDGAQTEIMKIIKSRVVVASAMRKEWAAFLPQKVEWIKGVELTPSQQAIYEDILNETIDNIEQDAKTNKELQKFLGKKDAKPKTEDEDGGAAEEDEEGEKEVDEDEGEDLASMLNPYLARLEQFMIAPGKDPLGAKLLKGEDLLSPKLTEAYKRIRAHIFGAKIVKDGKEVQYGPFPGKVLIFVNQVAAADEFFEQAPADLKKMGLLYKASDKEEILSQAEKNPNKKWMVGVVQSMEEGLNLQVFDRIIRLSSPWNPGNLEQSNSRIERPEFKKAETRNQIFIDLIIANNTIDITKAARLIAKVIAAAKFENADNPEYSTIPDVPVIPMNLNTIRSLNSWHYVSESNPGLIEYAKALKKFEQVRNDDYKAYKQAYIKKHGEGPVMQGVEVAPTPEDAKLLLRVPYVPGLGVYKQDELGLVRLDEYLNQEPDVEDDEAEEADIDEADENTGEVLTEFQVRLNALKNHAVHTEFGDGYIRKVSKSGKFLAVELLNGYRVRIRAAQVFLITRGTTNNKDIRMGILKATGKMDIAKPVDVPAPIWKVSNKAQKVMQEQEQVEKAKEDKKRQEKKKSDMNVELQLFVANGFLGLDYLIDESNTTAMKVLQANGFRSVQPHYYSVVRDHVALNNQMKLWKEKGLTMDPSMSSLGVPQAFMEMYTLLKSGQIKNHVETYKAAKSSNVVNFYRMEQKASKEKGLFKPYPIIRDGKAYIALPAQGQASTKLAMQYKRPAFRWILSKPTLAYFGTVQQVIKVVKDLMAAGMTVSNIRDLDKEITKAKAMKLRKPEDWI